MRSSKLRTIWLHIGLEKTGTTSIQSFLDINRTRLQQSGIHVPKSPGRVNHKLLAAYAFNEGSRDIAVTSANVGSNHEAVAAFRAQVADDLKAEFDATEAESAVISSEDLSRLFSHEEVARIVDLLRPLCERLQVIVFLRRQDLMASSRYFSLIIGGSREANVLPPSKADIPTYYFYHHNIGRWIDAVGAESVTLVRFPEDPKADGFSSVDTFCGLLGIDAADYDPVEAQHVSFDAVNQIIIQNFNVLQGGYDRVGMKRLMSWLGEHNDSRYRHIPSATQAQAFYDTFREDNRRLFERLCVQGDMFSEDFSMYPDRNMRAHYQQIAIRRLLEYLDTRPDDQPYTRQEKGIA